MKPLIRLVSSTADAGERAGLIEAAGFTVDASEIPAGRAIGHIRDLAPAAVLIDLDRRPSYGRSIAMMLRSGKSTCHVPLIFAGGDPEKVERVRTGIPGAIFTTWKSAPAALKKAIKLAPPQPVKPVRFVHPWAGSSLMRKLGVKPVSKIALLGAPGGFEEKLGEVPDDVEFQTSITPRSTLVIWFVRSRHELDGEVAFIAARLPAGVSVWIAFPKQSGGLRVDFTSNDVRSAGIRAGLVDYKICAIDADWSGLKFARRK